MLATLEGGCAAPIGALAEVAEGDDGDELWVRAVALSLDGALAIRMSATGTPEDAADLGARLARDMLAEGAADLTDTSVQTSDPTVGQHDQQQREGSNA